MILILSIRIYLIHRVCLQDVRVRGQPEHVEMEVDVDMSSGTNPESSDSDPGSPSDHGLPPAATYARRKKNPQMKRTVISTHLVEVESGKRGVVSKTYAAPEK